jgi:hypothetical protein
MDKLSGDRLMLIPTYFDAIDDGLQTSKECDQLHWVSNPPKVGDRLPMGSDRPWEVIAVDRYAGEAGELCLAHVHPVGVEVPAREEWYCSRSFVKRPLSAFTLHIRPDGGVQHWARDFRGEAPIVRRLLTAFDVVNHKTGHQPWGIESFDTYKPVGDDAAFAAVYLAHVVPVDLAEVEGAIVLESEKVLATAQ